MNGQANSIKIEFWGVRGSIPAPGNAYVRYGGNTPCVEISYGDNIYIFDSGTGIRPLGYNLIKRNLKHLLIHLFFSHTHWDHIQGLPFFTPLYLKSTDLHIYGGHCYNDIKTLLSRQMEREFFPVALNEVESSIHWHNIPEMENPLKINNAEISFLHLFHPALSLGFRVKLFNRIIVYMTDVELIRPGEIKGMNDDNINFLINEADVLIADCQFTEMEYSSKHGWGHSSIERMVDRAISCGVKNLVPFHHDPIHSDNELDIIFEKAQEQAGRQMKVAGAREGLVLTLDGFFS